MTETSTAEHALKVVHIVVNKKSVPIEKGEHTGLQIKQAAIAAGVAIELNFQLAEVKDKKSKIIGDNDRVLVHEGDTFVATQGDDNS